jgi:hypothetical protein
MAVTKWKPYLQHKEFTILTDHKSLIHLNEQKLQQGLQQKAFLKLLGLQFKVIYKKGILNKAADALSRQDHQEDLTAISISKPTRMESAIEGYNTDAMAQALLSELALIGKNDKGYELVDGIIKYKGRV